MSRAVENFAAIGGCGGGGGELVWDFNGNGCIGNFVDVLGPYLDFSVTTFES